MTLFTVSCTTPIDTTISKPILFNDLTSKQAELMVRIIAAGYNLGGNYSFDELLKKADDSYYTYDDDVLELYKYYAGVMEEVRSIRVLSDRPEYDTRIKDYIKNIISKYSDGVPNNILIDGYDSPIPEFDLEITSCASSDFLANRVYKLLYGYYHSDSFFKEWFDYFYSNQLLTDKQLKEYAQFLVNVVCTYTSYSNPLKNKSSVTDLYPERLYLNEIPAALVLAIITRESRLFPGSFRAEIKFNEVSNNKIIYAISLGLSHILIDADRIDIAKYHNDIGDDSINDYRTFALISTHYTDLSLFTSEDLVKIKGAVLYELIYLDMLYRKYLKFVKNM